MSEIKKIFEDSQILVTGATGFLGQLLIEKLLRACNNLRRIYIIVRPKKGKNQQDRLKEIFDGYLFDVLRRRDPNFQEKISLICGDFRSPGLGLNEEDKDLLKQNVNFIFHVAATVRFDQHIKIAFTINTLGTKEMLNLAKECTNLKAFIYTSTAYSNCPRREIDECFYKPTMKWTELQELVTALDDETLSALTPIIIGEWPNTYSFTKGITEDLVRDLGTDLPLAIVRPSIVVSTLNEPLVCWINNIYGAAGVAAGVAMGLIRVMRVDEDNIMDIVPGDMVMNSVIAAAWDVAKKDSTEKIPIYNYVSSTQRPITFGYYMSCLSDESFWVPALVCIWYYYFTLQKQRFLYNVVATLLHTIPAFIADIGAKILGKEARLMKGYQKVNKFIDVMTYFSLSEWKFTNKNVQTLWGKLNDEDKKLFNFDISTVDWRLFLCFMLRGLRLYTFNESFDTLEVGRVRYNKLKVLHYILVYSIKLLFLVAAYHVLKYCYNFIICM